MKKFLMLAATVLLVFCLAACSGTDGSGTDSDGQDGQVQESGESDIDVREPTGSQVTDTEFGAASTHEQLAPLDFEEGEAMDNPYYKRTVDPETNSPSYMVKRVSDGEPAYLPFDKTVLYTTDQPGAAFYERVPLSYKLDGEQVETEQYQLTVSVAPVPETSDADVSVEAGSAVVAEGGEAVSAAVDAKGD